MAYCQSWRMATRVDGNVYVRASGADPEPALVRMSPVRSEGCFQDFATLDAFRRQFSAYEPGGAYFDLGPRSVFRNPELRRLDVQAVVPVGSTESVPAEVLRLIGRGDGSAGPAGAFPAIDRP